MSTIWALLEQRAAAHPDALFAADERSAALTFAEARDRAVLAAGAAASDHGIGRDAVVSWLPERLELVDALPRNAMDKVLKSDLLRRYGAAAPLDDRSRR